MEVAVATCVGIEAKHLVVGTNSACARVGAPLRHSLLRWPPAELRAEPKIARSVTATNHAALATGTGFRVGSLMPGIPPVLLGAELLRRIGCQVVQEVQADDAESRDPAMASSNLRDPRSAHPSGRSKRRRRAGPNAPGTRPERSVCSTLPWVCSSWVRRVLLPVWR